MFHRAKKTDQEIDAFEQEKILRQHQMLEDNLKKGSISTDDQAEILKMRAKLPASYHQMPESKPSQCFWLFENFTRPDQQTWRNKHRFDGFKSCESRFLDELKKEVSSQGQTTKNIRIG